MTRQFNDLDQLPIRAGPAESESIFLKTSPVRAIEFVTVPMPFIDFGCSVASLGQAARFNLAWVKSKAHGSPHIGDAELLVEQADYRISGGLVDFRGVRISQSHHIPGVFNHRALQT